MSQPQHIETHRANVAARGIDIPSGMDAFGFPVPAARKTNALAHYRDMNPNISTDNATLDIGKIAAWIERDEPYEAERYWRQEMNGVGYAEEPRRALDLTGYYRLLSVLMTGPA